MNPIMIKEPKTELLKVRCEQSLKTELERVALLKRDDLSDVVRDACRNYVSQFFQPQQQFRP